MAVGKAPFTSVNMSNTLPFTTKVRACLVTSGEPDLGIVMKMEMYSYKVTFADGPGYLEVTQKLLL